VTRFAIDPPALVRLAVEGGAVSPDHQLVAPNSLRSLALDLLLRQVRADELSESEAMRLHEKMTELKVRLLGDRVSRRTAWQIAVEHGWSSIQDAEYVAVTKLQADALIALEPELVARAKGIVPLARFADLLAK
jgi:predicted nucleic acid-binding protein